MNKYFLLKSRQISTSQISLKQIESFRQLLYIEMQKLGATEAELSLICDSIILNSIRNNRKPEDVAWAVLQ